MKAPKVLGIGGSLLLVATAALHLSGYSELSKQLQNTPLPGFWRAAIQATWVFFSMGLVIIAAAVAAQFVQRGPANRAVLMVCMALLAGTVIVMAVWLGVFIGTLAIAIATLAIGTATAMLFRAPT